MKKLLVFFIVLSFLVPSVFADLTVKGAGVAQLNVLQVYDDQTKADDDDVYAKLGRGDDNGDGVRTQLKLTGSAGEGFTGFTLTINAHKLKGSPAGLAIDASSFWVKPLSNEYLRLGFGGDSVTDLRGKGLGSGTYGSYSHATLGGEDDIFTQFTGGDSGLVITSKPITGLTVGFSVKNMLANDITAFHKTNNDNGNRAGDIALASKAGEVWGKFHLAAGYDISGIGLARVGFLAADKATRRNSWTGAAAKGIPYSTGGTTDAEKSYWSSYAFPTGNLIQAAFNLTAVENLTLDFGFGLPIAYKVGYNPQEGVSTQFWKYSLPKNADGTASTTLPDGSLPGGVNASLLDGAMYYDTDVEFQAPLNVSLATEYVFGDFGARLRSDLYFGGSIKIDEKQDIPVTFDLHLHPFYNIPNIGKVGLEFGFNAYGPVTMKSQGPGSTDVDLDGGIQTLAFGGWFQKTLAGGTFRVGLAYSIPLEPVESYTGPTTKETNYKKDEQKSPGIFTIPVTFDYSF